MKSILIIYSLLLMSFQSIAGELPPSLKKIMTDQFSKILNSSYDKAISEYESNRSNPEHFLKYFNKQDTLYLKKLIEEKEVTRLPKLITYKEGHFLLFKGNKIFVSPSFAYDQKIIFNGKIFKFDKNLSLIENSHKLQRFMGAKKVSLLQSFIINDAEAFICGGFCVGALVLGTLALGAAVASSVNKKMNGSNGDLKKFREQIKAKTKQCDTDLNNVASHSSYFSKYNKSPGSFETFSNLKKVADFLEPNEREQSKVQEKLYNDYGLDSIKSCGEFTKVFQSKLGIKDKKNNRLEEAMGNSTNPNSKKLICAEINEYIDCLKEYNQIHKGHVNQGDGYKEDSGVYYDSDAHPSSKAK